MSKILIAVPSMDMVPAVFAQSLAQITKVEECWQSWSIGSLIYTSRNQLATQALEMEADYILWLDSDMVFKPDTLVKLYEHMKEKDVSFVSGIYYGRTEPFEPVLFDKLNLEYDEEGKIVGVPNHRLQTLPEGDELFEIEGAGFGCVLMKTDILFDSADPGAWFAPIGNVGEDCSFCIRARDAGYKLYADPTVQCGHWGHQVIGKGVSEAYRLAKASEAKEGKS